MADRMTDLKLKTERARKHITEFLKASEVFFKEHPYTVSAKRDANTREVIYYVSSSTPVPAAIRLIAGDAIQNLRSALDHLVWQLVDKHSGSGGNATEFPVCADLKDFTNRAPRKIRGVSQAVFNKIAAFEPYQNAKGHELWVLHNLNRIDKHRLLVAVGTAHRYMNVGKLMDGKIEQFFGRKSPGLPPLLGLIRDDRNAGTPVFPLETGTTLFVDSPESEINDKMEFLYEISFLESGIVEGRSIIDAMEAMASAVQTVIKTFELDLS
ncbi:MAG TPA: hypothetical protein VG456_24845 [Candidatus Sulfopaludibacter sp.]|jgi:hypothetical protein|nr:hypothetical protein [Candidatus Sulfopaludibacter sp.]